mmetsp:Transcript_35787/g.113058  ORF Transcript_35787/g.113058 Transcript_35787/m.113058 type:complete len:172 (-) Transcript_35787:160-675(-)
MPDAPLGAQHSVTLLAARRERESAQVVLRARISAESLPALITCSDLTSAAGGRLSYGEDVTLRKVAMVQGVPDALVPLALPAARVELRRGEALALWLSVDVPAECPPGEYRGFVTISAVESREALERRVEAAAAALAQGSRAAAEALSRARSEAEVRDAAHRWGMRLGFRA